MHHIDIIYEVKLKTNNTKEDLDGLDSCEIDSGALKYMISLFTLNYLLIYSNVYIKSEK